MSDETSAENLPLAALLDANIYYSDPALRGADALALLYFLKRANGRLALPEIVEREVEDNIAEFGDQKVKEIKKGLDYFSRLHNRALRSQEGDRKSWIDSFRNRMTVIEPLRIKMLDAHLRGATERVIKKIPPSAPGDQQYKDCLIWEAALELAQGNRVILVADDTGFLKPTHRERLVQEAAQTPGKIQIFESIGECLAEIVGQSITFDREKFVPFLDKEMRLFTADNAKSLKLSLDILENSETNFYPVELPHLVAVEFRLVYGFTDLEDSELPQRAVPHVTVTGNCLYSEEQESISEIRLQKMALDRTIVNGEVYEVGIVFLDTREPLTRSGLRSLF